MHRIERILISYSFLILLVFCCTIGVTAQTVVDRQTIDISLTDTGLFVEEDLLLINTGVENITTVELWIHSGIVDTAKRKGYQSPSS